MKKFLFLAAAVLTSFSASAEQLQFKLTDMAGNIFTGTYEGTAGTTAPSFDEDHCYYQLNNIEWDGTTFVANIDFAMPVSKVGGITNHTLITQSSWYGEKTIGSKTVYTYKNWHAVGDDIKVQTATPYINEIATWLWAIYPELDGNAFKFYIMNIASEKYACINTSVHLKQQASKKYIFKTAGAVQLKEVGTAFTTQMKDGNLRFCFTHPDGDRHMHMGINTEEATDEYLGYSELDGMINDYDHSPRNNNSFRGITKYNLTIGETGYATVVTPISVYSNDIKFYAVTSIGTTAVALTEKDDLYEGEAAVVSGTPGTYTLAVDNSRWEWADWSDNILKGTTTNTLVGDDAYVLSAPDGPASVGFYIAAKNKVDGWGNPCFLNNAYKAYLPVTVMYAARCLTFDFGTETGISETENGNVKTENGDIFDLNGRRVQNAQKGIFIVNGKKVVK
ncbi:MAG: hypothetical protein IKT87_04060 [Bacteroidaceae bacterium]|nr:hypothetical protein [Bacteroidaceae bacterium]